LGKIEMGDNIVSPRSQTFNQRILTFPTAFGEINAHLIQFGLV
jgi:hypothetical protein